MRTATAISEERWAVTEFATAELGEDRRTQRLVPGATVLADHPAAGFPEACGSRADLKATSRFFAKEALAPAALLASHVSATSIVFGTKIVGGDVMS